MKRVSGLLLGLGLLATSLSGCELCSDFDCSAGGGGGGGEGTFQFTRGVVFVRGGDVYAADRSDYATVGALTSGGSFRHPAISPDGSAVVMAAEDGSSLVRVSTAGAGLPVTLLTDEGGFRSLRHPVFTPDGLNVVFVFDAGGTTALGRVNADGTGGEVALTGGGTSFTSPSFDRQGRLLAASGTLGRYSRLEYVDVATGEVTPLVSSLGNEADSVASRAALSPDGRLVAFDGQVSSGALRLFVLDVATRQVRRLDVGSTGNQTYPAWVGTTGLVFTSDDGGGDQLYTVSLSGASSADLLVPVGTEAFYGPN